MEGKTKLLLIAINVIAAVFIAIALIVPVNTKKTLYKNVDGTNYGAPYKFASITNTKSVSMTFILDNQELDSVQLYFAVDGEERAGLIRAELCQGEELLASSQIPVVDLINLRRAESLKPREIRFTNVGKINGEVTLILKGEDIDPMERISLYVNTNPNRYLRMQNYTCSDTQNVLHIINVKEKAHPFVWMSLMIYGLIAFSSYILSLYIREKKSEEVKA